MAAALSPSVMFVVSFLYANLLEYAFHRCVMHHRWPVLSTPFETHTRFHHHVFRDGTSYHVQRDEDRAHVLLFTWRQAALWLGSHAPGLWALQWATGLSLFYGGMMGLAAYYGLVEYLHWCMHRPAGHWFERTRIFQGLDVHHRGHHQDWRVNFNLILPVGDILFGTARPAPQNRELEVGAESGNWRSSTLGADVLDQTPSVARTRGWWWRPGV